MKEAQTLGEWFRTQGLYLEGTGPFQILDSSHEPIYEGTTAAQLFAWVDGWKAAFKQALGEVSS